MCCKFSLSAQLCLRQNAAKSNAGIFVYFKAVLAKMTKKYAGKRTTKHEARSLCDVALIVMLDKKIKKNCKFFRFF